MENNLHFHPGQIVYLEHLEKKLYTEVIQLVTPRQMCWVRPLFLLDFTQESPRVIDLRETPDLLWALNSFQPALDTEVIDSLTKILIKETKPELKNFAKQELHQFIQEIWQANHLSKN
ncbi:hypothetical protein [Calothrix sp. 336/3]|uniref:hypothetical protein n=1 Tax=Calothrix sp. 336/3 TaxID=1337936 RepID=UPI0004E41C15|nr:hypothetical protein [Calothrix sp. 336/3]AKG23106.1 hypothetical protein IJ00_19160 [Calothrix sp. 336/3]